MKKVTMQDIADKLGVSKSLVSISLNNRYGVSDEMRYKIYLTAVEMGYDFKYNYKSKNRVKRNNIVAFLRKEELLQSNYWGELLMGVEKTLNYNNLNLRIETWNDETTKEEILIKIAENSTDGLIILNDIPNGVINKLKKLNIPVVFVDGKKYTDKDFDSVRTNSYLGGYITAQYFYDLGHRKMAFIGDKNFSISFRERYYGFKNFIDEHEDIEYYGSIYQTTFDTEETYVGKSNIVKEIDPSNYPTAIFCANDTIATFTYAELTKLKLRIPEDVSIIGFDNLDTSSTMHPPLTSVNVLKDELGQTATELLLNRIKFPDTPIRSILLSVELDLKRSVRRIK